MATIGRNAAVAADRPLDQIRGFLAWLLPGCSSTCSSSWASAIARAVFLQWVWAYFTHGKGAWLISGHADRMGVSLPPVQPRGK